MEELEDDVVVEQMAGLVDAGVVVATESAIVAFLVSHRPNQVSHPFSCPFFYLGL